MKDLFQVIDTIRLTEKATLLGEKNNEYVFRVHPKASKPAIRKAVESLFGKTVIGVRTASYSGKERRKGRADAGRANHWKKAIIRLKEGERFDLV